MALVIAQRRYRVGTGNCYQLNECTTANLLVKILISNAMIIRLWKLWGGNLDEKETHEWDLSFLKEMLDSLLVILYCS